MVHLRRVQVKFVRPGPRLKVTGPFFFSAENQFWPRGGKADLI